ncbi:glycosyltransferase family 1 protein [Caulobacter sp. SSI4214]|uniref:glycosyltransferase family 4 protein n=1 Tax=Caulobacter sp. SSI4214 TaxID=2575739 RepID=UPI001439C577|nr:glycosyltransferase family 1 protein [Caulobacter sp. SSI4214]
MTDTISDRPLGPRVLPISDHPPTEGPVRLVDTTMLYAPRSGGVRRYLSSKRAWLAANRPDVRHTLVVPGARDSHDGQGRVSIYATPLPFGAGYRWPVVKQAWMERLIRQRPDIIEAGDPYTPGLAALRAGDALGVPVVGFCHTDLGALAALHIGEWVEKPVQKRWAAIYRQFDRAVAPSRFIAGRLVEAGVHDAIGLPLGVDTEIFHPARADRARLCRRLGVAPDERLLVFAGRPAREKRLEVLVGAVERLGAPYKLLLVGAGGGAPVSDRAICMDYVRDPAELAGILASCDAFVHANDNEPFGLIVLEAMACGLPMVGVAAGGVAESVDDQVGQLATRSEPAPFAEAIEALFARDLAAVRAAARRRAVERHGWDAVFRQLCGIYGELTGRRSFGSGAQVRDH